MKHFIGIIIGMCLTGLLFAQDVDIRPYINQGNQLYDSANYRSAATIYKHAIVLDSTSFDGWFNFASALYGAEKFILATDAFSRAVKLQPDSVSKAEAYYGMGNAFVQLAQYQKAMAAYKKALLANPFDDDARYNYAYAKIKFDEEQQTQNQENNDDEKKDDKKDTPSELALQIKQKADELIAQHKFIEAAKLLENAAKSDETLQKHFGDFIQKVTEIASIYMKQGANK